MVYYAIPLYLVRSRVIVSLLILSPLLFLIRLDLIAFRSINSPLPDFFHKYKVSFSALYWLVIVLLWFLFLFTSNVHVVEWLRMYLGILLFALSIRYLDVGLGFYKRTENWQ